MTWSEFSLFPLIKNTKLHYDAKVNQLPWQIT